MPHWLTDLLVGGALCIALDLVFHGGACVVVWIAYRFRGDRGVAWLMGRTEAEVRRMRCGVTPIGR